MDSKPTEAWHRATQAPRRLLRWWDAHPKIEQLKMRPAQVFPRMTALQWAWYVPVVMATALLADRLYAWLDAFVEGVPVLDWPVVNWLPWLLIWSVLGGLMTALFRVALPAREARAAAVGEVWLIAALWALAELPGMW